MAKKASGKKAGKKKPARKTQRAAAPKKQVAKKAAKKSARKSAKRSKPPVKTAAKKAAKKAANKTAKKTSKKSTARKAAKKPAKKSSISRAATKSIADTKAATSGKAPAKRNKAPVTSIASPVAIPSRKPIASNAARKTARSRMSKRASAAPVTVARKIALRMSLSRRVALPGEEADRKGAAAPVIFEPAQLGFREAGKADWPLIQRLLVEAFGRTDESDLVERLRAGRELAGEFVAEYLGRPAAYIAFCNLNASSGGRAVRAAGLAPLAVAAELEKQGVGSRLVAYGLENMRGLGMQGVFVVGDAAYYERFGFSAKLGSRFESPWPGPHFLGLEFEPGALAEAGGAEWPSAFDLLP